MDSLQLQAICPIGISWFQQGSAAKWKLDRHKGTSENEAILIRIEIWVKILKQSENLLGFSANFDEWYLSFRLGTVISSLIWGLFAQECIAIHIVNEIAQADVLIGTYQSNRPELV